MPKYDNFEVEINDKFELMITGMIGRYIGVVIDWDEWRNGPIIKVEGFSLDLKPGDYILQNKIDSQS